MEIQWGDNYIIIERTVALILALVPVVFVISIPRVFGVIDRLFGGAKKKLAQKYPGHYAKHRGV